MRFLNAGSLRRIHVQQKIGQGAQLSAAPAR